MYGHCVFFASYQNWCKKHFSGNSKSNMSMTCSCEMSYFRINYGHGGHLEYLAELDLRFLVRSHLRIWPLMVVAPYWKAFAIFLHTWKVLSLRCSLPNMATTGRVVPEKNTSWINLSFPNSNSKELFNQSIQSGATHFTNLKFPT